MNESPCSRNTSASFRAFFIIRQSFPPVILWCCVLLLLLLSLPYFVVLCSFVVVVVTAIFCGVVFFCCCCCHCHILWCCVLLLLLLSLPYSAANSCSNLDSSCVMTKNNLSSTFSFWVIPTIPTISHTVSSFLAQSLDREILK